MALPLSINNPQSQTSYTPQSTSVGAATISYGGNALGSGASTSASGISNILIYGIIGLAAVWILQRIEES